MQRRRELMTFEHGHWATATGSIATFNTPFAKPLRSLKAEFMPVQEGTGDPSPDNIRPITGWTGVNVERRGKNLFDAEKIVSDSNNERTYIADGFLRFRTGTIRLAWNDINLPCPLRFSGRAKNFSTDGINTLALNLYFSDGRTSTVNIKSQIPANSAADFSVTMGNSGDVLSSITSSWTSGREAGFDLSVTQLELGLTTTTYEPFNGTTIPVTFPAVGKNLLKTTASSGTLIQGITLSVNSDGSIACSGTASSAGSFRIGTVTLNAGTYSVSGGIASNVYINVPRYVNDYGKGAKFTLSETKTLDIGFYFPKYWDASGVTIYPQIEIGSAATAYEPYTNTVYGGYVDLVKGEIWGEWELKKNSSQVLMIDAPNYLGDVSTQFYFQIPVRSTNDTRGYVDCAKYLNNSAEMNRDGAHDIWNYDGASLMHMRWLNSLTGIEVTDDRQTRITKIKAYIANNPIHTCTPLATPIMLGVIDPITITTLIGTNNIWSTANGNVTAEYWTR